jgi:hypothetical protein
MLSEIFLKVRLRVRVGVNVVVPVSVICIFTATHVPMHVYKNGLSGYPSFAFLFADIYLTQSNDHITLLLDLLEDHEFYVRFNTVQLLSTLIENLPDRVKECIFLSPGGIARLMDLLDDKRDIVRNGKIFIFLLTRLVSMTSSSFPAYT